MPFWSDHPKHPSTLYLNVLILLCSTSGCPILHQCEGEVHLAVTKKLLATQLGMTPETLSRVIGKLKKDNLLRESGNHLVLPNIQLLCESANLSTDLFK